MIMQMTRRQALRAMGTGAMAFLAGCQTTGRAMRGGRWYRGNLHMHTYWSDGRAFPEQAIDIYKKLGYDFIALSDHNVFADEPNAWRAVEEKESGWPPVVSTPLFDAYVKDYGQEVETKQEGGKTLVRLKTYEEMRGRFDEPGNFLLLPGVEITQARDGVNVHQNYINLPDTVPFVKGGPLVKDFKDSGMDETQLMAHNVKEVSEMAAKMGRPALLMLNHPQWVYWDIKPQFLIDNPEVRLFEVCNGGSSFAPHPDAQRVTLDSFWDAVNAFRSIQGAPLLFGVGSDDTHYYINRTPTQRLADAWIMVRASALTAEALLAAMDAGDFYATTGVLLEEVEFRPRRRILRVKVQPEPGVTYRIRFLATKRGFDPAVRMVECPAEKGRTARTIPVYSEEIGKTVDLVEGIEASYRMASDDLYVRAKIESSTPSGYECHFHPDVQVAWTQPHA
ncbi:MAG TPA: hypothetical protein PLO37_02465 [Candidatus Hydrogenedentes bacterium]|nr:hypothetical protein [Candidatus Hydrogenedentota bacterium]HPG65682.1 hypothetical protein [Candidatus Hydrogenedentota bacterium]